MFRPARTFSNPGQGSNPNRGFPAVGDSYQTTGPYTPPPRQSIWSAMRPIKGRQTWDNPNADVSRGMPAPQTRAQSRGGEVVGHLPGDPAAFGGYLTHEYPYFSRGTAALAPQFGQVSYNPIGAGVVANHRVQASYGPAAQYENGEIFWTSQAIPTSVNLIGLTNPDVLAAVLGPIRVQAAVRVNG